MEYRHEKFGLRNRVERFFRYLNEKTVIFHHKLNQILQPIHNILSGREGREKGKKGLSGHYMSSPIFKRPILK
jgi:hypothetical protein